MITPGATVVTNNLAIGGYADRGEFMISNIVPGDPANIITTDATQIISGTKTFTTAIDGNSSTLRVKTATSYERYTDYAQDAIIKNEWTGQYKFTLPSQSGTIALTSDIHNMAYSFKGQTIDFKGIASSSDVSGGGYCTYYSGTFTIRVEVDPKTEKLEGLVVNKTFFPLSDLYDSSNNFAVIFHDYSFGADVPVGLTKLTITNISVQNQDNILYYNINCSYTFTQDSYSKLSSVWAVGGQITSITTSIGSYSEVHY
jgi:hypothetical protein